MRSMPLSQLDNLRQTRTVNVARRGLHGRLAHGLGQRQARRHQLLGHQRRRPSTSSSPATVTSPATGSKPQTQTGLLTPGTGQLSSTNGTATVQLTDRDGGPFAGRTVSLSGASTQSATTNALGCAVFGYIPAGSYTIAVNGLVTIDSEPATDAITVYPGRASYNAMQVDTPATVRRELRAAGRPTFTTSMLWDQITVKNANLPAWRRRRSRARRAATRPSTDRASTRTSTASGSTPASARPTTRAPTTPTTSSRRRHAASPRSARATTRARLSVEMPTLRVNVTSSGCGEPRRRAVLVPHAGAGHVARHGLRQPRLRGPAGRPSHTSTATVVFDLALPFGRYRICAATRGRTSGTTGTATPAATTIDRRYTTTTTAGTEPHEPDRSGAHHAALAGRQADHDHDAEHRHDGEPGVPVLLMRRRLRQLNSDESGFTLPELLTAMVIGLVVLMAAFMLLDRTVASTARVSDRQEAVQRGRLTMELMTRQLRSQVCLADDTPILAGDDNSVTFYANLSSNPNSAQKRALRYVASEKRIYEDVYNGTGTYPALTFPASPTTTKELLRPVAQADEKVGSTMVTRPIFRYYRYDPATTTGDAPAADRRRSRRPRRARS